MLGYRVVGQGKTCIMVMSNWLRDTSAYDTACSFIDENKYTYCFVDLAGYGLSKHVPINYSLDVIDKNIIEIADTVGFKEFVLVGEMFSSIVAQYSAQRHKDRILGSVLLAPVSPQGIYFPPVIQEWTYSAARGHQSHTEEVVDTLYNSYFTPDQRADFIEKWFSCSTVEARLKGAQLVFSHYNNRQFIDKLSGLETPICVIQGTRDSEQSDADKIVDEFKQYYPHVTSFALPDAGYIPVLDAPQAVINSIEEFITVDLTEK